MEAAYWGVPSVSFATSPYDQLDSVHQPATREEAVRLVTGPVAPVRSEDALRYGYYYSRFGRPLRWAEPEGLYRSRFKGRTLEPRRSTGWRRRRARLRQALLS